MVAKKTLPSSNSICCLTISWSIAVRYSNPGGQPAGGGCVTVIHCSAPNKIGITHQKLQIQSEFKKIKFFYNPLIWNLLSGKSKSLWQRYFITSSSKKSWQYRTKTYFGTVWMVRTQKKKCAQKVFTTIFSCISYVKTKWNSIQIL